MPTRKIEPPNAPQKLSKYEQGYNDGYQAAKNESWILTEEQKPENETEVLICYKHVEDTVEIITKYATTSYKLGGFRLSAYECVPFDCVEFWMPLPKPPVFPF